MGNVLARKLIFRLGSVGFILDLSFVVEIREQVVDLLDSTYRDLDAGIVGALDFRHTWVPAIDPAIRFDLSSALPLSAKTALILTSPEGNWALLVDRAQEISLAGRLQPCEMPAILRVAVSDYYAQIDLLDNEPLVRFEPERFYGAAGLAS